VSLGFTQLDIKYEWNKLYVLGLHYRTTRDGIKNYIERISGYDVKDVKWFKPNGKAIVTLKTEKISGKQLPWKRLKVACTKKSHYPSKYNKHFASYLAE